MSRNVEQIQKMAESIIDAPPADACGEGGVSVVPQIEGRRCQMAQVLPGEICATGCEWRDESHDCEASGLGHRECPDLGHV